jgi:hypothetical protein
VVSAVNGNSVMNVSRGLLRAWILISVLWIVGAGSLAYILISPDTVKGNFQPAGHTKGGIKPWQVDYSKPFYETMRSPSAEKLTITFFPVDWQSKIEWDKDARMTKLDMPDGSRIYMPAAYNNEDRNYIAKQYWD